MMYKKVKRLFDIFFSALAIVGSSPFWIATIIGIEISDPGPIFYKADRIGKDNKEFSMYKFRSMRVAKKKRKMLRHLSDQRPTGYFHGEK